MLFELVMYTSSRWLFTNPAYSVECATSTWWQPIPERGKNAIWGIRTSAEPRRVNHEETKWPLSKFFPSWEKRQTVLDKVQGYCLRKSVTQQTETRKGRACWRFHYRLVPPVEALGFLDTWNPRGARSPSISSLALYPGSRLHLEWCTVQVPGSECWSFRSEARSGLCLEPLCTNMRKRQGMTNQLGNFFMHLADKTKLFSWEKPQQKALTEVKKDWSARVQYLFHSSLAKRLL